MVEYLMKWKRLLQLFGFKNKKTLCDRCPCLSTDFEEGFGFCVLGSEVELNMKVWNKGYFSKKCLLKKIILKDGSEIIPVEAIK
jgi:hypothetical protein